MLEKPDLPPSAPNGGVTAWNPARQCTGTSRSSGERCRRQPIPGGVVCAVHGGAAPLTIQTAKNRLLGMIEPVMAAFEEILDAWHRTTCVGCGHTDENGNTCRGCGKPTGDPTPVIRVGQLVLDRSGFHPSLTIQQAAAPNEYADFTEDQLIERLEEMLIEMRATRDLKQQHRLDAAAIDVVPDGTSGLNPEDDVFIVPEDDDEPTRSNPQVDPTKEPAND